MLIKSLRILWFGYWFSPSWWHVRPANQDTTRLMKLPCCGSNCLEQSSSLSALPIYQLRTFQSWVNQSLQSSLHLPLRTFCFKNELAYLKVSIIQLTQHLSSQWCIQGGPWLTCLTYYRPSVLWHCWLGHVTRKTISEMTYNVLSGMLNSTILYYYTGWLKLKYPTGQNALSRHPCEIFIPKFFGLYGTDPTKILIF